ncbi:MAG: hypothetical protein AB1640_03065 [bacterium]
MADGVRQALEALRSTDFFSWYLIPLLALVLYVYAVEVERRKWSIILAGLAVWGFDWLWEIFNALRFHASGYSAVWVTPGNSAYVILIGLTIEISFMFAIAGVVFAKFLPEERTAKVIGLNNRWLLAGFFAAFCVFVEIILNRWGVLVWNYSWWNWPNFWLIYIGAYLPMFLFAVWIHDMASMKKKICIVSGLYAVDLLLLVIFIGILGWI